MCPADGPRPASESWRRAKLTATIVATVRSLFVIFACQLALWLAGCSAPPSRYPYASEPDPRGREYVIAVSDTLSIRVWSSPDLNTDALVRPDGTITMPLVGDLPAGGRTPTQVKQAIARSLTAFVKDATVTVAVTHTSYRVTVSGQVERPGVFEAQRYLTVSEAIALAGGPTRFSSPNETVLVRSRDGQSRRIPIQFEEVEAGRHPEQDLVLLSGDRIYVP
jgi:polysaccharide biosynthesis/export protein